MLTTHFGASRRLDLETLLADSSSAATTTDWRQSLPVLTGSLVTLRELWLSDAPSLLALLATDDVSRFISPPPTTVDRLERFISWTHRERAAGNYICFGVVPQGTDSVVGIFQVRRLEPSFGVAEWGFVLGSAYWGTGMFVDSAMLVVEFAFAVVGAYRLEARAAVCNGRGNGALCKLGAVREGLLRRSWRRNGGYFDQVLWSIGRDSWRSSRDASSNRVH
jgi:RimJ/RimL family protein N-acetyltransferase